MAKDVFSVSRAVWEHPLLTGEKFTRFQMWLWIVSNAAWKQRRMRASGRGLKMVDIERGQLLTTVRDMARESCWSKDTVGRFLGALKSEEMIALRSDANGTLITVCNYNEYQLTPKDLQQLVGQKSDSNKDASGTEVGQEQGRIYRENKGNKGNKGESGEERQCSLLPAEIHDITAADTTRLAFGAYAQMVADLNRDRSDDDQLSCPQSLNGTRRAALKARLHECGGLEGWHVALEEIGRSSYLLGRRNDYRVTLDSLLGRKLFTKLMEGGFRDTEAQSVPAFFSAIDRAI